jgi:hypothetical protein
MSDQSELEGRIADLRAERDSLRSMSQEEFKRRVNLFRQFAEQDEGNDKRDSKAVEERLATFFCSQGLESPRSLLEMDSELGEAVANLAKARRERVAVRICVDPDSLTSNPQSGVEFRPDLSGSGEVFVQSDFRPPMLVPRAHFGVDRRTRLTWVS